jgi:Ca2+/H+ antiporter
MKIDWSFVRIVVLCFGILAVAAYYPLSVYAPAEVVKSVVTGGVIALLHLVMGYAAIETGFEKSHTKFLKIVIGGMIVRLFFMLALFFLLITSFEYDSLSLTLTLLVLYLVNLGLEVYHLQKRVSTKHPTLQL